MSSSFVFTTCQKRSSDPKHAADCYHWVRSSFSAKPYLEHGSMINVNECDEIMRQHFARAQGSTTRRCGDPWNDFTPTEAKRVRATCPPREHYDTNGQRPIFETDVCDFTAAKAFVEEVLDGSTFSVFARAQKGLAPTHSFFFHRTSDGSTTGNRDNITGASLLSYLDSHPHEEICISLGSSAFCDIYVRRIAPDNYLCTHIECL